MPDNPQQAHVKLGEEPRVVPGGPTLVSVLKAALGVDAADILYLIHGHERRPLEDGETLDVESGMHFEAVPGGGVS